MKIKLNFFLLYFLACNFVFSQKKTQNYDLCFLNKFIIENSLNKDENIQELSRILAYTNLSYYFCFYLKNNQLVNPIELQGFEYYLSKDILKGIDTRYFCMLTYLKISKELLSSKKEVDSLILITEKQNKLKNKIKKNTLFWANDFSKSLLNWIKNDRYQKIINSKKITYSNSGYYYPNWNKIRTILLENPAEFHVENISNNENFKGSDLEKYASEVYHIDTIYKTEKEKNLFYLNSQNINIFNNGKLDEKLLLLNWVNNINDELLNLKEETKIIIYALYTISIFDGLLTCWNTKNISNIERPTYYIKKYFSSTWDSKFQNPNFSAYFSQFALINGIAGEVLLFLKEKYKKNEEYSNTLNQIQLKVSELSNVEFFAGLNYKISIQDGIEIGKKIVHNNIKILKY